MSTNLTIILAIWSVGLIVAGIYYLNFKIRMNHFEQQMEEILEKAVNKKLYQDVEPFVYRTFEATVKDYLLESKVVDNSVMFRWSKKNSHITVD